MRTGFDLWFQTIFLKRCSGPNLSKSPQRNFPPTTQQKIEKQSSLATFATKDTFSLKMFDVLISRILCFDRIEFVLCVMKNWAPTQPLQTHQSKHGKPASYTKWQSDQGPACCCPFCLLPAAALMPYAPPHSPQKKTATHHHRCVFHDIAGLYNSLNESVSNGS